MNKDLIFKIVIIGDSGVGKSSIILRYIEDIYQTIHQPTIGIDFVCKHINYNNIDILLHIWDTAGQERFKSIIKSYYNNTQGIILCFDITNVESFNNIILWIDELNSVNNIENLCIILVGTKYDLVNKREIEYDDADNFAKKYGFYYMEISSKNKVNINELFSILTQKMIEKFSGELLQQNNTNTIQNKLIISNKKCC